MHIHTHDWCHMWCHFSLFSLLLWPCSVGCPITLRAYTNTCALLVLSLYSFALWNVDIVSLFQVSSPLAVVTCIPHTHTHTCTHTHAHPLEHSNATSYDGQLGYTPLHFASLHGLQDVVKFLIEKGASVDAVDTVCCVCLCVIVQICNSFVFP